MKDKKEQLELMQHLRDQYDFLSTSSKNYDLGNVNEAKRIAVHIRVMVHDTVKSCSLLKQLKDNFGTEIKILSHRNKQSASGCLFYTGLTIQMGPQGIKYVPMMDLKHPRQQEVSVEDWWNTVLVVIDGEIYTRKDIILGLANKDGGAHVDLDTKNSYHKLTRETTLYEAQGAFDMGKFELVVARESSFYLLHAINKYFKDLLN